MDKVTRAVFCAVARVARRYDTELALRGFLTRHGMSETLSDAENARGSIMGSSQFYLPKLPTSTSTTTSPTSSSSPSSSPSHHRFMSEVKRRFRENADPNGLDVALAALAYLNQGCKLATDSGMTPSMLDAPSPPPDGLVTRLSAPRPGSFLIAHPMMGHYWHRSVIYMLEHDPDRGSYGIVVSNRSVLAPLRRFGRDDYKGQQSVLQTRAHDALGDLPVFDGGPVRQQSGVFLSVHDIGGTELRPEVSHRPVHVGGSLEAVCDLVASGDAKATMNEFLMFLGGAGWGPGQLDDELNAGTWVVAEHPDPWSMLQPEPVVSSWESMLISLGGELAAMATIPESAPELLFDEEFQDLS